MTSNADTTALLSEVRLQTQLWERSSPIGGRKEFEAAEAATRAMAELDAALCDGAPLPVPWQLAQYPEPDDDEAHVASPRDMCDRSGVMMEDQ